MKTPPSIATDNAPALAPARMAWVDVARGMAMLLVIIGHAFLKTKVPFELSTRWIYSFHLPLFFFISGVLIKDEARQIPWLQVVLKSARSLLIPYAFFGLISYLIWVAGMRNFGHHGGNHPPVLYPLVGLLYGVFNSPLKMLDPPLWFFPCLFCTLVLHRSLPRSTLLEAGTVLGLFLLGVAWVKLCPWPLPWGLDLACLALTFLYVGQKLRPWLVGMSPRRKLQCLFAMPFLFLLQTICAGYNAPVDIAKGLIGVPPLFLLGAFSGTLATIFLCFYLPFPFLGSLLGRNTIIVFPLHLFCFVVLSGIFAVVPTFRRMPDLGWNMVLIFVILTCLSFFIIVPVVKALFPWLTPVHKASHRLSTAS